MKLFNSITKITTSGYIKLVINNNGEFELPDDIEVKQKGRSLHIKPNNNNNNNIIVNGNYSLGNNNSNIVMGNSNFVFNNNGCTVLSQGVNNQVIINSNIRGDVTFNGSIKNRNNRRNNRQNNSNKTLNETLNKYMLEDSVIEECLMNGSGKISIDDSLLSRNFKVILSGSGKMSLSNGSFKYLKLVLSGSGNITGKNITTENTEIILTGSGNIKGFHVLNTGNLNLTGSGKIKVSKKPGSTVYKNCIGSGRISIV